MNEIAVMNLQLALAGMEEGGVPLYSGPIDGKVGTMTVAGVSRLCKMLGVNAPLKGPEKPAADLPENAVLVFSLREDGEKQLSEHFKVREFACDDGSDVVLIHQKLPGILEQLREINGAYSPTSSYRTVTHNAAIGGATYSQHCRGFAADIPAVNATPEELYAKAEEIMGGTGGLGIYDWGIHVDVRAVPARFDYR